MRLVRGRVRWAATNRRHIHLTRRPREVHIRRVSSARRKFAQTTLSCWRTIVGRWSSSAAQLRGMTAQPATQGATNRSAGRRELLPAVLDLPRVRL